MIPVGEILCGHAAAIMACWPDNCIDLIITSLPYHQARDGYEAYLDDFMSVFRHCRRVLRPNGKLCLNAPLMPLPSRMKRALGQHTRPLRDIAGDFKHRILTETDLRLLSVYIWRKQTSKRMQGAYPYPGNNLENNCVEFIHVYVKPGEPPKFDMEKIKEPNKLSLMEHLDLTQQIWNMHPKDTQRKGKHLAPFPEKLPARLIKLYTFGATGDFSGEVVLDPFVGTGTTCAVAKMMGRRYIGVDINEKYVRLAQERVDRAVVGDKVPFLVGTPHYPTEEEIARAPEVKVSSPGEKGERKHKRKTFGRSARDAADLATIERLEAARDAQRADISRIFDGL